MLLQTSFKSFDAVVSMVELPQTSGVTDSTNYIGIGTLLNMLLQTYDSDNILGVACKRTLKLNLIASLLMFDQIVIGKYFVADITFKLCIFENF